MGDELFPKIVTRLMACCVLAGAASLACVAQQNSTPASTEPSATNQPVPQTAPQKEKDKDKDAQQPNGSGKVAGTSNDRLFYALPNFLKAPENFLL
jgi:hypothetical protein